MKHTHKLWLALATITIWSCTSIVCPVPPRPRATISDLLPGRYELVLRATEGSRSGAIARGFLWLQPLNLKERPESPLYGWTDLDFSAIGAPVSVHGDTPAPTSTDPKAPGVLVLQTDHNGQYPTGAPILVIGTGANAATAAHLPDGTAVYVGSEDGSGIGLRVHDIREGQFVGRWSEWGIAKDGRGVFCAKRLEDVD